MFEGVVSQVLAGYLGRYVKGIQKDQLKIGIWNEEILLENVELILEAFDYLQLPFALKSGKVGKLSIKIPWKKLGWDPIIVVLEDVFICACQREESEWSSDSIDRRELAGKLAKLNAIELAKFSRRVSDNQTGQSFISYVSAKILDNIQVSIQNVHIIYIDSHEDQENFIFGLRFSTLTITTDTRKLVFSMSSIGRSRVGQVNKIVVISTVEFYCKRLEEHNFFSIDDLTESQLCCNLDHEREDYIINPFDVLVSVRANKSGMVDGGIPQYDITVELSDLVLSLNEIQLRQIFGLWDYFTICGLRKKYGRYRPSQSSLSKKVEGWQILWWHYAQQAILADVRQRLRRISWSNLGQRLNYRRRYIDLYRRKLELLQNEQVVSKDILQELEKMDKECDIDDILSYRSFAERQLQDLLLKSKSSTSGANNIMSSQEKNQNDEQSASRARRWLNWLSLGMLGAGGTADTSSFAGVVSDEIIKDV
ncbi:putative vacuolar protein sorting-associated protein 13A [Ananas comosus]|uniref:Vacuolar protein sorting-associated protein 13A n=1 Tax=Ananas comosus TaxID=4615 RepID=A0A6P5HP20_ANACO|nr:putative vacuolar protein sorting-associated protein 13A [Ananas comosus]